MYNNYEMAKNDLDGLQLKLENLTKSKQQLEKMDPSKNTYFAYGILITDMICKYRQYVYESK